MPHATGYPVSEDELRALAFSPHQLEFRRTGVQLPMGVGCEWRTLGDVPDGPGLYAFTVDDSTTLRVMYVGRTAHLWMVTKGRLPRSGGARGGQRYGRPANAGATRQRINVRVTAEVATGHRVTHWLRPMPEEDLAREEEALIRRWRLREVGWNRG